jgi:glycosyltransferase involved in cell wall biosynthesis
MKIAFTDNLQVAGGLSRFSLKLCKALIDRYKDLQIDYFIHEGNLKQIPEIKTLGERVNVRILETTKSRSRAINFANKISGKLTGKKIFSQDTDAEIKKVVDEKYDLVYFPSAHMMKFPDLKIPVCGTIHDFNWRYFFGTEIFDNAFVSMMNVEIQKWMNVGYCISSAHDVVNEAKKLYPGLVNYPAVVPIAQVVVSDKIPQERADDILKNKKIDFPYIIFPGNFFPHKNHLNLFTGFSILKKDPAFKSYKLLLTGMGTQKIKKAVAEYRGVKNVLSEFEEYDIAGMGYQSNEDIDALIMNADLLVSPSIYEAICTPGMDAWSYATPTAISDIPPFREHETAWGIKSAFFDPMNPHDIAAVMADCLKNKERSKQDALISQHKLSLYTWDKIAEGYMNVFLKAVKK